MKNKKQKHKLEKLSLEKIKVTKLTNTIVIQGGWSSRSTSCMTVIEH